MRARLAKAARVAALLVAVAGGLWQLSLVARLWWGVARYPWDIEWLESSALYQAYRVMRGLPTYGPMRDGFLPLNHPPLYPAVLGYLGRVIGLDYLMARTLSLVFFAGAAALVVRAMVRRMSGRAEGWVLGILAVGAAGTGVPLIEGVYLLVREDMMAVFLCVLLAALVDGPRRLTNRRIALLAVLTTAIVYTRQPAVFFPVWVTVFVFLGHRRSGFLLALSSAAACGLVLVALLFTSKGWYWLHTVGLVQVHGVAPDRFVLGLKVLLDTAPYVAAVPLLLLVLLATRRLSASGLLWSGMLVAAIPAGLLPFAKVGGFSNDFIPIVFLIGPATAALLCDAFDAVARHPRFQATAQALVFVAGGAFLIHRSYGLDRWVPNADTNKKARALNARVAALEGGAISPRSPFLAPRNGITTLQWSDMPYLDMLWAGYTDLDLGKYIDGAHARWALVSGTEIPTSSRELSVRYQLEDRLNDSPATLIGERNVMRYLLKANDEEKNARVLFDFESLAGWTVQGDAFSLTPAQPSGQLAIQGVVGKHIANSYSPKGKDTAKGTMISPRFVVDRRHMSLRVGGGWNRGTRVELRVAGRTERTATSIWEYQETMTRFVWDVRPFLGKEAQLWLIDEDAGAWAHLLCDHVVLYD
jgi:hypothetical protein